MFPELLPDEIFRNVGVSEMGRGARAVPDAGDSSYQITGPRNGRDKGEQGGGEKGDTGPPG